MYMEGNQKYLALFIYVFQVDTLMSCPLFCKELPRKRSAPCCK